MEDVPRNRYKEQNPFTEKQTSMIFSKHLKLLTPQANSQTKTTEFLPNINRNMKKKGPYAAYCQ